MDEYRIVSIAIISNMLIKVICFWIGYLTIKLGHKLMTDGIKGEFKFSANYNGIKGGLLSSSPGLLYLLLGIILIGYAMSVTKTIEFDSFKRNKKDLNQTQLPNDTKGKL